VEEFNTAYYPDPIVEHNFARERAIAVYKAGILRRVNKLQF
jgi:deoxyribodipyrimidine photolyase